MRRILQHAALALLLAAALLSGARAQEQRERGREWEPRDGAEKSNVELSMMVYNLTQDVRTLEAQINERNAEWIEMRTKINLLFIAIGAVGSVTVAGIAGWVNSRLKRAANG